MDPKIAESITDQIYKRFPEVDGVKPTIKKQQIPDSQKHKGRGSIKHNYLFTFKRNVKGPGNQKIIRWIRVVATPKGKIVKVSTSK
jgi:hypothetical protein